jgi:hypothetical protein
MRPYNEWSRLTMKLQYFTRKLSLPPPPHAWRQLWRGNPPHTPPLGNGVQARLKQTYELGR